MFKIICPACKVKDPVISVIPREYQIRERAGKEYKARRPSRLKCKICGEINLQWHFNPSKLKRFKEAKRGRPLGSKNKLKGAANGN